MSHLNELMGPISFCGGGGDGGGDGPVGGQSGPGGPPGSSGHSPGAGAANGYGGYGNDRGGPLGLPSHTAPDVLDGNHNGCSGCHGDTYNGGP